MNLPGTRLRLTGRCLIAFTVAAVLLDRFIHFPEKAAIEDVVSGGFRAWPTRDAFRGLVAVGLSRLRRTLKALPEPVPDHQPKPAMRFAAAPNTDMLKRDPRVALLVLQRLGVRVRG
jgi:hypothetical protein